METVRTGRVWKFGDRISTDFMMPGHRVLANPDLSVEDAMKLVFSGGIVLPEAVSLARVPRVDLDNPPLIGRFEAHSD